MQKRLFFHHPSHWKTTVMLTKPPTRILGFAYEPPGRKKKSQKDHPKIKDHLKQTQVLNHSSTNGTNQLFAHAPGLCLLGQFDPPLLWEKAWGTTESGFRRFVTCQLQEGATVGHIFIKEISKFVSFVVFHVKGWNSSKVMFLAKPPVSDDRNLFRGTLHQTGCRSNHQLLGSRWSRTEPGNDSCYLILG